MILSPLKFSSRAIGALQMLGSGLAFGFLGVFGKSAYDDGLSPGEFLALRFAFASIMMWALTAAGVAYAKTRGQAPDARDLQSSRPLGARTIVHCAILGAAGYAVFSSCYFIALKGLSASLTVLLLYAYPPLVTLGAWLILREKPKKQALAAMPFAAVGLVLLVWGDLRADNALSFVYGLMAAVFYSAYILASSRWLRGVPAMASARWVQTFAALALALIHLRDPARAAHVIAAAWPALIGVAAISTVGAMALFLAGLKRLTSSEASLLSLGEPVAALLLSAAFLGDRMSGMQAIGGALTLAALALVAAPRKDRTQPTGGRSAARPAPGHAADSD